MQARKPATQAYLIHDCDSFFARRLDSSPGVRPDLARRDRRRLVQGSGSRRHAAPGKWRREVFWLGA